MTTSTADHPMTFALRGLLCLVVLLGFAQPLAAQQPTSSTPPPFQQTLRLFLDCSGVSCDLDFFRTEIDWVDYVRNREDSDIHLLITSQPTGSGGTEYTLSFIGRRAFAGKSDTLRYVAPQTATEDDRRRGLAQRIKLGLARYVAETPAAERLEVSYSAPAETAQPSTPDRDPWNFWTFRASVRGFFNGESRVSSESLSGTFSANRTTEAWKLNLAANGNRRSNRFEISDSVTVTSEQNSYGLNGLAVRSLGPHWSVGGRGSATSSTFLNQDLSLRIAPAIEYSIFPYSESTRKLFTVLYSVGVNSFDYEEQTIFGKLSETRIDQSLLTSLDVKQPWGSASISLEGANYLDDFSQYRAVLFGDLEVRLFRGLSLNLFGSTSYVRDQLYISAGGASTEEVLLRLRELETSYRYFCFPWDLVYLRLDLQQRGKTRGLAARAVAECSFSISPLPLK